MAGAGPGTESVSLRIPRSGTEWFEDADEVRHRRAAHVHDAGEPRVRDLHVAGLPGHLHRTQHMHRDAGRADRVALRFEPARRVDREPAVLLGPAFEDGARP